MKTLKERAGYAGKSQQWQYGFDLACNEMQAEIDALKTAQTWQPIESAPRDQPLLLATEFFGAGDWRIKCGYFDAARNVWRVWGSSWMPTHWMPLPPAPETAK